MIKHFGPRVICKSHGPVELYSGCNTVVSHEIESENSMSVAPRAIKGLHVTVATFLWSGPLPPCSQIEKSVDSDMQMIKLAKSSENPMNERTHF